jgi:hypothetical protein
VNASKEYNGTGRSSSRFSRDPDEFHSSKNKSQPKNNPKKDEASEDYEQTFERESEKGDGKHNVKSSAEVTPIQKHKQNLAQDDTNEDIPEGTPSPLTY